MGMQSIRGHIIRKLGTAGLQSEVKRVKKEVFELLWQHHYQGIKRTQKEELENKICSTTTVIDRVLSSLEHQKLIKGALGSSGIKITTNGEIEYERLQSESKTTVASKKMKPPSITNFETYDVFVSHASEDKDVFLRPLVNRLKSEGLMVWYDEFSLQLGDSLRESIDHGLANSRYGLVIISHNFIAKDWPQRELNGLFSIMKASEHRIIPVWHEISSEEVKKFSPILSDIIAANSSEDIDTVVEKILDVCMK
jgi:hypothetical protein